MRWVLVVARRTAGAGLVLAVLSVLIFAATEVLPGDASGRLAGVTATEAERQQLATDLGLDQPAARRYLAWAAGAVRGDLGTGYIGGREVSAVLADRLPNSLLLAGIVLAVAVPLAVGLGLVAGLAAGRRRDRTVSVATLVAVGTPEFLTAVLLTLILATWSGLLPRVSLVPLDGRPWQVPQVLVLPALSLAVLVTAVGARLVRASVADQAGAPYLEAARLAGVRGWRLAVRHVLPNAIGPAVPVFAIMCSGLIAGAVVVETFFNYPGIGYELQQAVANRDVPMVQGLALALCAATLGVLLLADLVGTALNPRLRSPA